MATYSHDVSDNIGGGLGLGGGGGWLLGGLIIFLLIFKDGFFGHRGGREEGHGGDRGRERNWFPDESNFQLGRELDNHMCKIDKDVRDEGEKTRDLITQNLIDELREGKSDLKAENQTLKTEIFVGGKIGKLEQMIEYLMLQMPKAEPQYVATRGHCLAERPSCGEPRRGGCGDFAFA